MKVHLSITSRLALIFVLFATVLLGGVGALAYINGQAGLQQAATSELLTRAIEKQAALDTWITVARSDIATQAESPVVAEQAAALLAAAPGSPQAQAAHDQLVRELQPHIGLETEFTDLFFMETDTGQVLVATDPDEEGKFKETQSFFIQGKRAPYVSEMYYSVALGRPAMTAATPIKTANGRLLGVLAGRLDLETLNAFINRRTGLRQTDDAFLVNAIGLLVTQPRFISDPGILQQTLKTEAVKRCLGGNSGVISADDYRGVPALISYRWLPERQMCLIVKIDQAEAFAPVQSFGFTLLLTGALGLLAASGIALALARTFTRPILALQTGAARVEQGDLEYRVAVKSQDEIGRLAAAFNEMAASLGKQVAERKRAEEAIRKLNEELEQRVVERTAQLNEARDEADRANKAKSEFLSRMSHELRTPLNAILGFGQLLELDQDAFNSNQQEGIAQILKAGNHLLQLINEVLDIARVEAGRMSLSPEPVAILPLAQEAADWVQLRAAKRNIALNVGNSIAESVHVYADRQRLKQVLLNLLSNAVKYNRAGGAITLAFHVRLDQRLRIEVHDTGPGISPAMLPRLFTPFERLDADKSKTEGTGLGLVLSKRLIEAMGGSVGVESVVGEGSTFWIELALVAGQTESAPAAPISVDIHARAEKTLLYVEDNLSNLKLIQEILDRRGGFKLITAMQGSIGIELAKEHHPDLIVLDVNLPDMHGDEVVRWLKDDAATRAIPIIVLSADSSARQIERLKATGVRAYLTKPLDVKEFLRVVEDVVS